MERKKGDITDVIMIIITIFFLAVSFVTVGLVINYFTTIIQTTGLNDTTVAPNVIEGLNNISTNSINNGFIMIFAFLIIGLLVSSFLVRYHPIFIFLFIIFAGLAVFLAAILSNTYETFYAALSTNASLTSQPVITWIMSHLVAITIGISGLGMVVLFSRIGGGTQAP